jgi:hypothetical protein
MYFKAGNKKASKVVKKVESIGFECTIGPVDFFMTWVIKFQQKNKY